MIQVLKCLLLLGLVVGFSRTSNAQKGTAVKKLASKPSVESTANKNLTLEKVQMENYSNSSAYMGCYCELDRLVYTKEPIGFDEIIIQLNGEVVRVPVIESRNERKINEAKSHYSFKAEDEDVALSFSCDEIFEKLPAAKCQGDDCHSIYSICDLDLKAKKEKKSKKYKNLKGSCVC